MVETTLRFKLVTLGKKTEERSSAIYAQLKTENLHQYHGKRNVSIADVILFSYLDFFLFVWVFLISPKSCTQTLTYTLNRSALCLTSLKPFGRSEISI